MPAEPKSPSHPMTYSLPRLTHIRAIETANPSTRILVLDTMVEATPGQFVMLWLPRLDEKPFSLVAGDPLTVAVACVGPFTGAVHRLQVGDRLWWRGPLGHGFQIKGQRLLLVGGGYGVAPLAFLADRARTQDCEVAVAVGARTSRELLLMNRFHDLAVRMYVTTEDGSAGHAGIVTDLVVPLLARQEVDTLYGCGPEGMLTALQELGHRYSVPTQLSWEAYMRCGIGLCGSCDHGGRLVCWDGPVFEN